jgi:hypothetical protein
MQSKFREIYVSKFAEECISELKNPHFESYRISFDKKAIEENRRQIYL